MTSLEVVGDFHSHPDLRVRNRSSCWLSQEDKYDVLKGDVCFAITIDRDNTEHVWKHLSLGSVLGSVFPYSLKVSGWSKVCDGDFRIATREEHKRDLVELIRFFENRDQNTKVYTAHSRVPATIIMALHYCFV